MSKKSKITADEIIVKGVAIICTGLAAINILSHEVGNTAHSLKASLVEDGEETEQSHEQSRAEFEYQLRSKKIQLEEQLARDLHKNLRGIYEQELREVNEKLNQF